MQKLSRTGIQSKIRANRCTSGEEQPNNTKGDVMSVKALVGGGGDNRQIIRQACDADRQNGEKGIRVGQNWTHSKQGQIWAGVDYSRYWRK